MTRHPHANKGGGSMLRSNAMPRVAAHTLFLLSLTLTLPLPQAFAKEKPPQVTEDGLELKKQTRQRLVYMRPGANFTPYNRVALVDCYVEFSKTWLRVYNSSQHDPNAKVKESDLERAKTSLSAQF